MKCVAFQSRVLPNALMVVEVVISLLVQGPIPNHFVERSVRV